MAQFPIPTVNKLYVHRQIYEEDLYPIGTVPTPPRYVFSDSEVYFTGTDGAQSPSASVKSEYVEGERILAPLDLLTFCVLVLRNGFTVTGESACASPENFDPEIGRKIARENAVNKIWLLEGYLLKQKLSEQ